MALVALIHHPAFLAKFNHEFVNTLLIDFLLGLTFILRDIAQLSYEHAGNPAQRGRRGFSFSMAFVSIAAVVVLNMDIGYVRVPAATALFVGALADGVVFTALSSRSLFERLLYSNIVGAIVHQLSFYRMRSFESSAPLLNQGVMERFLDVFFMALPVLIVLGIYWFSSILVTWITKLTTQNVLVQARAQDEERDRQARIVQELMGEMIDAEKRDQERKAQNKS